MRVSIACSLALSIAGVWLAAGRSDAEALWTDPVVLFSTDKGFVSNPVLVTDSGHGVHLFFVYSAAASADHRGGLGAGGQARSPGVLMYAQLRDGRWSFPVDALAASDGSGVAQPDATVDSQGFLHVIWKRGSDLELEYSRAHVSQAISGPWAWTRPEQLTRGGLAPGAFGAPAAIAASPDGSLHVVYAARDGGIRYRRLDTEGRSWSTPVTIAEMGSPHSMPDLPRVVIGATGRLHVTWTEFRFPEGWPPTGSFASLSDTRGATWTEPVRVAGEDYGLVTMIASKQGIVHRVWNAVVSVGERRHQWSADDGSTWASSVSVAPTLSGGFTGFPALALDSSGGLHLVTSVDRQRDVPSGGGIYHLEWHGARWTDPVYLSKGAVGTRSLEQPAIAVSEGNRLHVTYEEDFRRIWYTTRLLDAPTLPALAVPPPPAPTRVAVEPTATPLKASGAARSVPSAGAADFQRGIEPTMLLLIGLIPSLSVIGVIALFRVARSS